MATLSKFNCFVEDLAEAKHNLGADTFAVALLAAAPVATNSVLSDLTQISYTNLSSRSVGTATSSAQSGGTYTLKLPDLVLTASGAVATFRYVVLYNDTSATDALIGWYDYGSNVTLASGDTFTVDFDATNGVLTIA